LVDCAQPRSWCLPGILAIVFAPRSPDWELPSLSAGLLIFGGGVAHLRLRMANAVRKGGMIWELLLGLLYIAGGRLCFGGIQSWVLVSLTLASLRISWSKPSLEFISGGSLGALRQVSGWLCSWDAYYHFDLGRNNLAPPGHSAPRGVNRNAGWNKHDLQRYGLRLMLSIAARKLIEKQAT